MFWSTPRWRVVTVSCSISASRNGTSASTVALKSYFLTCQYIGEEMARVGYGKIINITSIVGRLGSGGSVPWGACRGGVDALTYGLAQSLGEYGVRCVGLARGATDSTPYTEEALQARVAKIPFKRLGTEKDITGPAIFLATAESDWITGSVVYADAGYAHAAATDLEHRATEFPLKRRGNEASRHAAGKKRPSTSLRREAGRARSSALKNGTLRRLSSCPDSFHWRLVYSCNLPTSPWRTTDCALVGHKGYRIANGEPDITGILITTDPYTAVIPDLTRDLL